MKKFLFIVVMMVSAPCLLHSQTEYPHPLEPGKNFKASAAVDTLFWVLKSGQYDKCLQNSLELKNTQKIVSLRDEEIQKLNSIITEKSGIVEELRGGYEKYKKDWEECDIELEKQEVKVLKLKRAVFITGAAGILVGILVGAVAL